MSAKAFRIGCLLLPLLALATLGAFTLAAVYFVWSVPPGAGGGANSSKTVEVEPQRSWSAEDIAADPTGYLVYAQGQIDRQVADRKVRLASLADRARDVQQKKAAFDEKFTGVENVLARFETAIRRADDEDRWPLKIAGRSFDQPQARAIVAQSKQFLADHAALAQAYDQAAARLRQATSDLQADVAKLARLREKLALDLERVKLTQGMEELGLLRQTEAEIAGFARDLAQMADDRALLQELPPETTAGHAELDALLSQK